MKVLKLFIMRLKQEEIIRIVNAKYKFHTELENFNEFGSNP